MTDTHMCNSNQLSCSPVIVCLIAHFICAFLFIWYICQSKYKYPHQQNSPYITCIAQFLLLVANILLVSGRIVLGGNIENDDQCQQQNAKLLPVDLAYTFCEQFIIFSYLMKLLRLLPVYWSSKIGCCQKLFFKNEMALIIISSLWATTITIIEGVQKNTYAYFQFYTFFCESTSTPKLFLGKMTIYLILYVSAYLFTYSVNEKLNFRSQYNILLAMYYCPALAEIIYSNDEYSSIILVYYVSLGSNLLASFTMFLLYFLSSDEEDYFAHDSSEELYYADVDYILKEGTDWRYSFTKYCDENDPKKYYELYDKIKNDNIYELKQDDNWMDQLEMMNEEIQKIKESRIYEYKKLIQGSFKQRADEKRKFLKSLLKEMIYDWEKTLGYAYLQECMKKNSQYNERMKILNLKKSE